MDTESIVSLINVIALVTIMLSMGLQVTIAAVVASARPARRVVLGVVANYLLVPLLTVGLLLLFQPAPPVAVGFLILAVCPGAPVGPPATALARGNVAWAIGLMVVLASLSAVLSPALLGGLMPWVAGSSDLHVDYLALVRTLVVAQLLPLAAGLVTRQLAPSFAARIVAPAGVAANVLLVGLIGLILVTQFDTLIAIRARAWAGMTALFFGSLVVGWLCGTGDQATRKASAVTTAARNAAVGLAIATGNLAGTPAVSAVVAYGLVSMVGTLGGGLLLGRLAAPTAKAD